MRSFFSWQIQLYPCIQVVAGAKTGDEVNRAQKVAEYAKDGIEQSFGATYEEINSVIEARAEIEMKRKMENMFNSIKSYEVRL